MIHSDKINLRFYGIISLEEPIVCRGNILGGNIKIKIGETIGYLHFPKLPTLDVIKNAEWSPNLVPPKYAKTWKQGEDPVYWGRLNSYSQKSPHKNTTVAVAEKLLLSFEASRHNIKVSGNNVHQNFENWHGRFVSYINLLTKQSRYSSIEVVQGNPKGLELICWDENKNKLEINDEIESQISVIMRPNDHALTRTQLFKACNLASNSSELSTEYLLQLEAYKAHCAQDYRKAIIETAVAAELAVTKEIQTYFSNTDVKIGEGLLKKFRMLGGRIELARIFGINLPNCDIEKTLVNIRNDVIHKASFANKQTSLNAIKITDEILRLYNPSLFIK